MTTDRPEVPEQPDELSAEPEQVTALDDEFDPTETLGGGAGRTHGRSMLTPDQMRPPPQEAMEAPPAPTPPGDGDVTADPDTDA
ncbi:hypothetical protein GCM10010306_104250 [Streptomyces umbrinus]|uniref:hypothetical protein n=1 Tax=Streptomyces umbrinus TaxID=67370 RepID=UPI001672A99C|nr:hypothetical protein [Streptomyces umbrinus]GHB92207.1 hypothetical protein GCM10010306_104250 [Streptomyces umbrinus]